MDIELPFRCPECDKWLRLEHPRLYTQSLLVATLCISGSLCFHFGARGEKLFWGTLLCSVPVFFMLVFWTRHFAPPKLKPSSPPDTEVLGLNR